MLVVRSQSNPRLYLFEKADSLYETGNTSQAKYYYSLSLKQEGAVPDDYLIKQKVITIDSISAYEVEDTEFLVLIFQADSLLAAERYIKALKYFDDASSLQPGLDYPHARIDQIIEESQEVKKQLLIYNAKQNQLAYAKALKDIEQLEKNGFELEAYFKYKEFAKAFHGDSLALSRAEILKESIGDQIDLLLKLLADGEAAYFQGEFITAKEKFDDALVMNPKCEVCRLRLDQVNYCLKEEVGRSNDLDQLYDEALANFEEGKYQKAYYQFSLLSKRNSDNENAAMKVKELEELLELETDERMRKFNADITLEKANNAFLEDNFDQALTFYLKLKNAYAEDIDYLQFVELRIAECLNELEN